MRRSSGPPKPPPGSQTLVKYLVAAGVGSRRDSAELIMAGRVRVNSLPVTDLTHAVRPRDRVDVNGAPVRAQVTKNVYLLLNKPAGYLSTVSDDRGRKTVLDLVPEEKRVPGLVPAGRLDLDTTGLMLLTNDGDLVDVVTHPRYGVEKEYRVLIDRPLTQDRIRALVAGLPLEEGIASAKSVRRLTEENGIFRYAITLVEGKKREVRRMLMAVERRVVELERMRLGNITLGQLPVGQTRELTAAELRGLLAVVDRHPQGRSGTGQRQETATDPNVNVRSEARSQRDPRARTRSLSRSPSTSPRPGFRERGTSEKPDDRPARRPDPSGQDERRRPYQRPPAGRTSPRAEDEAERPHQRPLAQHSGQPRGNGQRQPRGNGQRQRGRPTSQRPPRRPAPRSGGRDVSQ